MVLKPQLELRTSTSFGELIKPAGVFSSRRCLNDIIFLNNLISV